MASPFEHAWMLLKNVMDFAEIAGELPEPNPLDAALAQARNQPPPQGANLEALPPAGPDPKRISNMFSARRANPVSPLERGLRTYSRPSIKPIPPQQTKPVFRPPPGKGDPGPLGF